MKKIKVLFFVDRLRHGGIQQFLMEVTKQMDKTKFEVHLLSLDDGENYPLEQEIAKNNVVFHKLHNIWIKTPIDFFKYKKAINKFFEENQFDIVHLNGTSKNYLLLKCAEEHGVKVRISHAHSTNFMSKNVIKRFFGNILKNKIIKYSTLFFACSKAAGEWLFENKEGVLIIPNAVDYEKYKYDKDIRNNIRKDLKIDKDTFVVGHVGRFTYVKNHKFLIDIFSEIKKTNNNSVLVLVGVGELEDTIKKYIDEKKIKDSVIFLGFRNDVNKVLQAFDCFVMPSLYEGLPLVCVEAQAAGLPCYVSDTITPEVKISNALSFISLQNDEKQWAATICSSDNNRKNTKKELQENGYILENMVANLSKIYVDEVKK